MNRKTAILLFIILIGTVIRFAELGHESLWTDEMLSVDHARQPSAWKVVEHVGMKEAAPPGHYLLLHYWIKLFADSDTSVRLPSVLFSIAAIVLMYVVMKLYFSDRAALIATLLFSVSLQQVVYAQEARLYSMFTFMALLTTYLFIRGFVRHEKRFQVVYFIALTIALYTNYLAVVLIVMYGFLLLWKNEKTASWIVWTCSSLLLSVPLIPLALHQFVRANSGLSDILSGYGVPASVAELGLVVFALPSIIVCILLGSFVMWKKHVTDVLKKNELSQFLFTVLIVLFCAVYVYMSLYPLAIINIPIFRVPITNSYFLIRHSLFLVPLLYAYAAWKTDTLRRTYVVIILAMILVTQAFALNVYYMTPTKPDWKGAMDFVQQNNNNNRQPFILLDRGGGSNALLLQRYLNTNVVDLTQYFSRSEFYQIPDAVLLEMVKNVPEFWLVLSKNHGTGDYYRDLVDAHFERAHTGEFYGVQVYQYSASNDNIKYAGTS